MGPPPPIHALPYILQNKDLIQAHIEKHKQSWDPAASEPLRNDIETLAESSVSVYVRVRPLLLHDIKQSSYSLAAVQSPRTVHFTHPTLRWAGSRFATKTYESDGAFSDLDDNETVYRRIGFATSLHHCIAAPGKELYVLAYGQTGTGKTYTTTYIEQRIVDDLFNQVSSAGRQVTIHTSIFEIRDSAAYDLLSSPPFAPVKVTTTASFDSVYPGLGEHTASNATDLLNLLKSAASLRFTRSTTKNDTSSRSHAVVRFRLAFDGPDSCGTRSLEGSRITTVIKRAFERNAGVDEDNGGVRMVVIACVSPSVLDSEDSLNTLNYVTPFRLAGRETIDASDGGVISHSKYAADLAKWDHDQSIAYIQRNLPKFRPFIDKLLPSPDSTITSLLTLSQAEMSALISGPPSNERKLDEESSATHAKLLAQAKSLLPSYHTKLRKLATENETVNAQTVNGPGKAKARAMGATREAALQGSAATASLNALNGKDLTANVTGPVTKISFYD